MLIKTILASLDSISEWEIISSSSSHEYGNLKNKKNGIEVDTRGNVCFLAGILLSNKEKKKIASACYYTYHTLLAQREEELRKKALEEWNKPIIQKKATFECWITKEGLPIEERHFKRIQENPFNKDYILGNDPRCEIGVSAKGLKILEENTEKFRKELKEYKKGIKWITYHWTDSTKQSLTIRDIVKIKNCLFYTKEGGRYSLPFSAVFREESNFNVTFLEKVTKTEEQLEGVKYES